MIAEVLMRESRTVYSETHKRKPYKEARVACGFTVNAAEVDVSQLEIVLDKSRKSKFSRYKNTFGK